MAGTPIDSLEREIPGWMAEAGVPGLSLALLLDARVAWARGFGVASRATGRPVTPGTVFEAASLTKPAVAYAALRLCEAGVLDLDAPLSSYLPEPYLPDEPRLPLITLHRVLCHTPGLPNFRPEGQALRMAFTPGERFSYSSEGFIYLRHVVEHALARPLAPVMRDWLLDPLGMAGSSLVWLDGYDDWSAQGHDTGGRPVEKERPTAGRAAGSLHTTPSDYARFVAVMLDPPEGDPSCLSAALRAEMLRPQVQANDLAPWHPGWPDAPFSPTPEISWGLGWGLQHGPRGDAFWQWGDNGPFQAFVLGYPGDGSALIAMGNAEAARGLWGRIYGAAFGGPQPALGWLNRLYGQ